MRIYRRKGSTRILAIGLCGFGLLGVLIAVAIMANFGSRQAETSLRTKEHAEQEIEGIQEQLDTRGREAEEMLEQMDGRPPHRDGPETDHDEDEPDEEERLQ